jgi:hypothetical protein
MKNWTILAGILAFLGALVAWKQARASTEPNQPARTSVPPAPPSPQAPVPAPKPVAIEAAVTYTSSGPHNDAGSSDDRDQYSTGPEDAEISDPGGWVRFGNIEVTALPLTDRRNGLFARLKYDDALEAARRLGGEILTEDDLIAIHEASKHGAALEIQPVTLVKTADDSNYMASLSFAKTHDAKVRAQLAAKGWDGSMPVSNVGKYWLPGGFNFGWWVSNAGGRDKAGNPIIQSKGGAHIFNGKNTHIDYSQLTMLKRAA